MAVTLQRLLEGTVGGWSLDQELVLAALRRSKTDLENATEAELAAYLKGFDEVGLQGVISNVKGIYHELLLVHLENTDGDETYARMFEASNHPGADIEFIVDGGVVRELQLKTVQDPAAVIGHFEKYPDIDVLANIEVVEKLNDRFGDRMETSGVRNEDLSKETRDILEQLAGEDLAGVLQDGVVTSLLVGGALQAKAILSGQGLSGRDVRSTLELMGVAAGTAAVVDALLNLV